MKNVLKSTFVFTLLVACVQAQAQVIESVSYTPAKTGNYETISSKSVTSFAGNLTADDIIGQGHKLVLDADDYQLLPSGQNILLGASRDMYMLYNSNTISNVVVNSGGKLYTPQDATINASTVKHISGGDLEFEDINMLLNSSGKVTINGAEMSNPRCSIKWAKLPAYTLAEDYSNATEGNYWFAYCDADSDTSGTWQTSVENVNLVGTCTAGWDGATYEKETSNEDTSDVSSGTCIYEPGALSGSFTCSAYTIKQCTGRILPGISLSGSTNYTKACNQRTEHITKTNLTYKPDWNNTAKCGGNVSARPLAVAVYNESIAAGQNFAEMPGSVSHINGCLTGTGNNLSGAIAAYKIGLHKLYCGFSATSEGALDTQIKNVATNKGCIGTVVNYPYCSDVYGNGYADTLDNEAICARIKLNSPASITNLNNFTCIKSGLDRNAYQAARVKTCQSYYQESYQQCLQLKCNDTRCRKIVNDNSYATSTHQAIRANPIRSSSKLNCSSSGITALREAPSTTSTVYFPQYSNSQLLHCNWTD